MPVAITVNLIKAAMKEAGWGTKEFLIDGFPRNEDNQTGWEEVMKDEVDVKRVLFFEVSEDTLRERLLKRGETSGRVDDNLESIIKRFKTFVEQTMPIVEMYEKQGKVFRINGAQTVEAVFADVEKAFA